MRRLLITLSIVSLLLCVGLSVLWGRSYKTDRSIGRVDSFSIKKTEPLYWFISGPGKLTLCGQRGKRWDNPLQEYKAMGFRFGGLWGDDGSLLWNLSTPYWALVTMTGIPPVLQAVGFVRRRRRLVKRGFSPVLNGAAVGPAHA